MGIGEGVGAQVGVGVSPGVEQETEQDHSEENMRTRTMGEIEEKKKETEAEHTYNGQLQMLG